MKHLDTLLDELQHPVAQLLDWCEADKDRAVVACLWDLLNEKSARLFEALSEAYPDLSASNIIDHASTISEEICIPSKFYTSAVFFGIIVFSAFYL